MTGEFLTPNNDEQAVFEQLLGIEQRIGYHLESLDIERHHLTKVVDDYVQHHKLQSLEAAPDKIMEQLFDLIEHHSQELGIFPEVEMEASGQTLYILEEESRTMHFILPSLSVIQGNLQAIVVLPIPTYETFLSRVSDSTAQPGDRVQELYEFGICLELTGKIVAADQDIEEESELQAMLIPLNYPGLHLSRIVRSL